MSWNISMSLVYHTFFSVQFLTIWQCEPINLVFNFSQFHFFIARVVRSQSHLLILKSIYHPLWWRITTCIMSEIHNYGPQWCISFLACFDQDFHSIPVNLRQFHCAPMKNCKWFIYLFNFSFSEELCFEFLLYMF